MRVDLLHSGSVGDLVYAYRVCTATEKPSQLYYPPTPEDLNLLKRAIADGHTSPLEHMNYTWVIEGISRACLQELVRHRIASYSVQSTRWTLRRIKNGDNTVRKVGVKEIDDLIEQVAQRIADMDYPNDVLKYALPEAWLTKLVMTMNARSFRNFIALRLTSRAHAEIRELATRLLGSIPQEHRLLYDDIVERLTTWEAVEHVARDRDSSAW